MTAVYILCKQKSFFVCVSIMGNGSCGGRIKDMAVMIVISVYLLHKPGFLLSAGRPGSNQGNKEYNNKKMLGV